MVGEVSQTSLQSTFSSITEVSGRFLLLQKHQLILVLERDFPLQSQTFFGGQTVFGIYLKQLALLLHLQILQLQGVHRTGVGPVRDEPRALHQVEFLGSRFVLLGIQLKGRSLPNNLLFFLFNKQAIQFPSGFELGQFLSGNFSCVFLLLNVKLAIGLIYTGESLFSCY